MSRARILIVDDEAVVRESLTEWFATEDYETRGTSSGREALEAVEKEEWDLALVDLKMPGMDGIELHRRVRQIDPDLIVIIMTGFATIDTAVHALKQGAYDYLTKPVDPDELSHIVEKALEHRRARIENVQLRECLEEVFPATRLIGNSQSMKRVIELVEMVAPTPATVLITGESGTGKEVVARAIHAASPRRAMPMITIHCGALTETLLESELFGHERGAFTGAQVRKKGKFELADGGTVFLDEIADISLKTQTDLLRVLQEHEIVRVGGGQTIKVDFRCIAATNKDLKGMVAAGTFRPDLFYRLNVVSIEIPPLRDRKEDIPLLIDHFLQKFAHSMNRAVPELAPEVLQELIAYDWPGNVRELENAVERALVMRRGPRLESPDFPFQFHHAAAAASNGRSLEEVERAHVEHVFKEVSGNISKAARILHIDRTTLYSKLRRYGLR
jgi:DNA-binding NtrC family response regulator